MNRKLNIISTFVFAALILGLSLTCWLKPETAFSEGERRYLAKKPELSTETIATGEFMERFEEYTTDQIPLRDEFRTLKTLFATGLLGRMENNGIYTYKQHISKIEYPENPDKLDYAAERFDYIYSKFIKDTDSKIYLSIVPDKNYFLAPKRGHLALDYPSFADNFKAKLPYMKYIDIFPLLSEDDYYLTDSHWKQECIWDVALHLGDEMGTDVSAKYEVITQNPVFMGVYAGQSALPTKGDSLNYLMNDTLRNVTATYVNDRGMLEKGEIYNMEKAQGKDPYEMFLSGSSPLVFLANPNAKTDKELVIFRDSFGGSLAPLFAEGYKNITVVDIRYVQSDFLGQLIEFNNQDVLFIYSTTLLNNSTSLR